MSCLAARLRGLQSLSEPLSDKTSCEQQTNEFLFGHNDAFLITGVEGQARITSFPSHEPIHSFDVGLMPVTVLDLDPRGRCVSLARASGRTSLNEDNSTRFFVAGCNDTLVSLWETESWTCVATSGVHECVDLVLILIRNRANLTISAAAIRFEWSGSRKTATTWLPVPRTDRSLSYATHLLRS